MKKANVLMTAAFVIALCVLSGCETDVKPQGMTFVDDIDNTVKEFTIYEDFSFKVKFLEDVLIIGKDEEVTGKITNALKPGTNEKAKYNDSLTGSATKMSSSNDDIKELLKGISIAISLTYTDDGNKITLQFISGDFSDSAQILMGGTYTKTQ